MQSNPFAEIALDGSLLLAAPIAVLAGLISFLSPCVLPLVPGYLGYVTGLGGDVLTSRRRGRLVLGSVLFVLGFAVVFVGITVVFTQAMVWLRRDGAWVTPVLGVELCDRLKAELLALVSKEIGSFAKPELMQWAPGLPKTRSGKIMRRILRKIACNELDNLGDTSTLADPSVVDSLIEQRLNR